MGRRTQYSGSTIGNEMEEAIKLINAWQQLAAAALTSYEPSTQATIAMLFEPAIIERSRSARGIVRPMSPTVEYQLTSTIDVTQKKVRLGIDYTRQLPLPIEPSQVMPQDPQVQQLQLGVQEVERIYRQYEEVKGVLRWLNGHCTLNAIRAIFPAILRLCPATFRDMHAMPSRYQEPYGLHNWLQALRNAGNTVAAAQMLPDIPPRHRQTMWLVFESTRVNVGEEFYMTDYITINL